MKSAEQDPRVRARIVMTKRQIKPSHECQILNLRERRVMEEKRAQCSQQDNFIFSFLPFSFTFCVVLVLQQENQ